MENNDRIAPSVWRQRKVRAISIHELPSGQRVKMRGVTTPDLYEAGMQPISFYNKFRKLETIISKHEFSKRGKSKEQQAEIEEQSKKELLDTLTDNDMPEMIKMARQLAVLAVIEPALTHDVVKEPDKFPVDDVQFPDLMAILGIIMPQIDGKQFFRKPGPDTPPASDGEGIRSEAEQVPERVVE